MPISDKTVRYRAAGQYLRGLREAREMTIRELAARLGFEDTSSHIISMIESGRVALPRAKWYLAAQALGAAGPVFGELMLKWYLPDLHRLLFDQLQVPPTGRQSKA